MFQIIQDIVNNVIQKIRRTLEIEMMNHKCNYEYAAGRVEDNMMILNRKLSVIQMEQIVSMLFILSTCITVDSKNSF